MTFPHRRPDRAWRRRLASASALLAGGVCAGAAAAPLTAVRVIGIEDARSAAVLADRIRQLGGQALVRRAADGSYTVQAGAFANPDFATRQAQRLREAGLQPVTLQAAVALASPTTAVPAAPSGFDMADVPTAVPAADPPVEAPSRKSAPVPLRRRL